MFAVYYTKVIRVRFFPEETHFFPEGGKKRFLPVKTGRNRKKLNCWKMMLKFNKKLAIDYLDDGYNNIHSLIKYRLLNLEMK